MKRILVWILAGTLIFGVAGCQKKPESQGSVSEQGEEEVKVKDSLEVLENAWELYEEEEKFPAMGGGYNQMVENAPGKVEITDAESLQSLLIVPEEDVALLDDAASMMHAMNANTFTSGVFRVKEKADVETFTDSLKKAILNNHWMCGFPEKLLMVQIGEQYVVSAFGNADILKNFETHLQEAYPAAKVIVEESL